MTTYYLHISWFNLLYAKNKQSKQTWIKEFCQFSGIIYLPVVTTEKMITLEESLACDLFKY